MSQRLFVGLVLPADVRASLDDASRLIRLNDSTWASEKWVPASNLHVTLAFLGQIEDQTTQNLVEALGESIIRCQPAELAAPHVSAVPGTHRCRMIWAGFEDRAGNAETLANAVRTAAVSLGIDVDDKPFRAHVTLCRARRAHAVAPEAIDASDLRLSSADMLVSDPPVTLFSSRLTPRGPLYGRVATWRTVGE